MEDVAVDQPQPEELSGQMNAALGLTPAADDSPQPAGGEPGQPTSAPDNDLAAIIPEKFRSKPIPDAVRDLTQSYTAAEKAMHERMQEAANLRRANEQLAARLAAAEQVSRMMQPQAPQQQRPADQWQQAGVNPDEDTFLRPRQVLDTTVAMATQRALQAVAPLQQQLDAMRVEREQNALMNTFEVARAQLNAMGHKVPTPQEFTRSLKYIAPSIIADPNRRYDPNAYVAGFTELFGTPTSQPGTATLPAEGNAPVAGRSGGVAPADSTPTLSREQRQLAKQFGEALGFSGAELEAYIKKSASNLTGGR